MSTILKKEEANQAAKASITKQRNQEILAIIADKQKEDLRGKSVEELEKLLTK
jgi:hypothetical protein